MRWFFFAVLFFGCTSTQPVSEALETSDEREVPPPREEPADTAITPLPPAVPSTFDAEACASCLSSVCNSAEGTGICGAEFAACDREPQCDGLLGCGAACDTDACLEACEARFPGGVPLVGDLLACTFCRSCSRSCGGEDELVCRDAIDLGVVCEGAD
ncbi:MAG: hypothetical protein AAGA56_15215 [Myxococcota bacterium]